MLGTFIALLPEAVALPAVRKIPANAVTTSMLLLSLVLWPAAVMAQSGQQPSGQTVSPTERRPQSMPRERHHKCISWVRRTHG